MKSYWSNQTRVSVNRVKSSYLHSQVGVPQGSILGPFFFSLYINDLPNICPNINAQLYADDAAIFIKAKSDIEVS